MSEQSDNDPIEPAVPTEAEVLGHIEAFLKRTGMKQSRFGRDALGEASFVKRLREGSGLTLVTARRALDFISGYGSEGNSAHADADTLPCPVSTAGKSSDVTATVTA